MNEEMIPAGLSPSLHNVDNVPPRLPSKNKINYLGLGGKEETPRNKGKKEERE